MHKPDFDFQKHVQVPDRWIKNALNIPETAERQKKVIPIRRYVTAASVILVFAVSIGSFFFIRNKNTVTVAPVSVPSATEASAQGDNVTIPPTEPTTDVDTQQPTSAPTEASTQKGTDSTDATVIPPTIPTEDSVTEPTPSTAPPTQQATEKPADMPTQKPTQKPTVRPTEAQRPTQKPTSAPATEKPTQPYSPDMRTVEVILPIREAITASEDSDGTLYCCVYDSKGRLLGDSNLYSRSHWLDVRDTGEVVGYQSDAVCYYYAVEYDANQVPDGRFTYRIYLSDGTVLQEGTVNSNM